MKGRRRGVGDGERLAACSIGRRRKAPCMGKRLRRKGGCGDRLKTGRGGTEERLGEVVRWHCQFANGVAAYHSRGTMAIQHGGVLGHEAGQWAWGVSIHSSTLVRRPTISPETVRSHVGRSSSHQKCCRQPTYYTIFHASRTGAAGPFWCDAIV
jgi:hypothetical protein